MLTQVFCHFCVAFGQKPGRLCF